MLYANRIYNNIIIWGGSPKLGPEAADLLKMLAFLPIHLSEAGLQKHSACLLRYPIKPLLVLTGVDPQASRNQSLTNLSLLVLLLLIPLLMHILSLEHSPTAPSTSL